MSSSYVDNFVDQRIGFIRNNPLVRASLGMLLVVYISLVVPNLDVKLAPYIANPWFRFAVLTVVALTARQDLGLALLVAAAFMFTTDHLFKKGLDAARKGAESNPLVQAAMNPFGDSPVRPVVEWIDSRPSKMRIANEFANPDAPPSMLQGYVPDDVEQLAPISM